MNMAVQDQIEQAVQKIITALGEDPQRNGLKKTPYRVAKMYQELLQGYQQDLDSIVGDALFDFKVEPIPQGLPNFISVCHIPYQSLCEHHLLPFIGVAHVAYIPGKHIIGLSKIPRIVDMFAQRLQVQECLTQEINEALNQVLTPQGTMVVLQGEHMCASMRGVKKSGMQMSTRAVSGFFSQSLHLQQAFMQCYQ
jgi:GTP cyclohydrolase IA